jgi:hypothetical protein
MSKFSINRQEEFSGIRTTTFQISAVTFEEAVEKAKELDIINASNPSIKVKKVFKTTYTKRHGF